MAPVMSTQVIAKDVLLRDLTTSSYTPVPFGLSNVEIREAVATFFEFLTLPQETKDALCAKRPTDAVSDMGYIRTKGEKDQEIGYKDHKEYFHYHPEAEEVFANAAHDPKVRAFFDAAGMIYEEASVTVKNVIRELSTEFPNLYENFFPEGKPREQILRFLKYDSRGLGQFLARAHYDRGGCTLALAESAPGLRIGKDDASLTPVVHKDRTALFMPAPQLHRLTNGRILPAWHDVVQASGDTVSEDAARWAVVFFVNAPGLEFPTAIETHVPVK